MITEEEMAKLTILLAGVEFDGSDWARTEWYQGLLEERERLRDRLCAKLDDRRVELLEELWNTWAQMEHEHILYYLYQGLRQGVTLAGGTEISWDAPPFDIYKPGIEQESPNFS